MCSLTSPRSAPALPEPHAGRQYSWRLKAWESGEGPKRTYLFEQCRPFQQAWQVQPRTTLAFYQMPSAGECAVACGS